MVSVTAEIDRAALDRLEGLLASIAEKAPVRLASETRRAAIYICQSLRKRTKSAPKRIRSREYAASISTVPPKYVHSNSSHHKLLRRWTLTRKVGTPDEYSKHYFVYTARHRVKGGKMAGGSQSAEKRELVQQHGGIPRHGLAKKSWGWAMNQIHSGTAAGDLSWKRTKGERRDPRHAIKGLFRQLPGGAEAQIQNKLDYILDALPPGALDEAVNAAAKRLEYNVASVLMDDRPNQPRQTYAPGTERFWKAYARAKNRAWW